MKHNRCAHNPEGTLYFYNNKLKTLTGAGWKIYAVLTQFALSADIMTTHLRLQLASLSEGHGEVHVPKLVLNHMEIHLWFRRNITTYYPVKLTVLRPADRSAYLLSFSFSVGSQSCPVNVQLFPQKIPVFFKSFVGFNWKQRKYANMNVILTAKFTYSCPPCFPRRHPLRNDDTSNACCDVQYVTAHYLQIGWQSVSPERRGLQVISSGASAGR